MKFCRLWERFLSTSWRRESLTSKRTPNRGMANCVGGSIWNTLLYCLYTSATLSSFDATEYYLLIGEEYWFPKSYIFGKDLNTESILTPLGVQWGNGNPKLFILPEYTLRVYKQRCEKNGYLNIPYNIPNESKIEKEAFIFFQPEGSVLMIPTTWIFTSRICMTLNEKEKILISQTYQEIKFKVNPFFGTIG